MPNYRRLRIPSATYFFTVVLAQRSSTLLVDHIDTLRSAYAKTLLEAPIKCDAIVILPDHLHAIWTLPENDCDYSDRWRRIKARFSNSVAQHLTRSSSKIAKRETGIWQRRFWEHTIRDEADYQAHMHYCWGNPVKHGLVKKPTDWPFSSIHRDIRRGQVDPEWSGQIPDGNFGE